MAAVGYRFHPTDEELIAHYLKLKMNGLDALVNKVIGEVDVYRLEPSDLPRHSLICSSEDQVWYFFCRLDYKYKKSKRASRATESGFWKITGKRRFILARDSGSQIGVKKTLVFYYRSRGYGKPINTDWVIHEYQATKILPDQKEYVICKLKHKGDDWTKSTVSVNGETNHVTPVSDVENHALAVQVQESSAPAVQSLVCLEECISIEDLLEDNVLLMEGANNGPSNSGFESDEDVDPDSYLNNTPDDYCATEAMYALPNDYTPEKSLSTYHPEDGIPQVNVITAGTPETYRAFSKDEDEASLPFMRQSQAQFSIPGMGRAQMESSDEPSLPLRRQSQAQFSIPGMGRAQMESSDEPSSPLRRQSQAQFSISCTGRAQMESSDEASSPFMRQSQAQFSMASLHKAKPRAEEATKQLTRAAVEAANKRRLRVRITGPHSALELSPAASSSKVCKRSVSCIQMVEILTGHEQSPPTVYICNILVALLVLAFFIYDLPFLR